MSHDQQANLLHIISELDCDGKTTVEIKKTESMRSLAQNNLYRMWVTLIANEVGHTHNEIHEFLSKKFIPIEAVNILGQLVEVRKSTKQLLVGEFSTLLEHVEAWAGEYGISLPQPADQYDHAMKRMN